MMPPVQGKLTVERMCTLAQVSRAGFYRWLQRKEPGIEETAVRAAIQEIAVEHRRNYGYRRVTAELRHRGMAVNRKRVLRMMQDDNGCVALARWINYAARTLRQIASRVRPKFRGTQVLTLIKFLQKFNADENASGVVELFKTEHWLNSRFYP